MLYSRPAVYPPIDTSLTLPETVDFHWKHNSELPAFAYNEEGSSEITEISFLEFGRAIHRVAHSIRPNREGNDLEVVAFIALTDAILYQAITVGMMKAGLIPFPISPRNTPAAVVHMLKKTNCHRLITTQVTLKSLIDGVRDELATNEPGFDLNVDEIPALDEIYPKLGKETVEDPFKEYPAPVTRQPVTDIAAYLHSSGSTGFPKPIPQTYETFIGWASFPCLSEFRDHNPRLRMAGMHLPAFHTLGVYTQILYPLYGCTTIAVYPPTAKAPNQLPVMPTPDNILDHTRRTKSNCLMSIPALLQIWAQNKDSVDFLKDLEFVGYSGGGVAPKLGDFMVASGVKLNPGYGGTEFGSPTYSIPRKGDEKEWAWMEFSDRAKIRWVPQGDGTFECQFLSTDTHPLPVENLDDVRGYATSDLWEKHPTKDYLWRIVGRIDDVIIHSSGEKTVPAPMEDIVMSSSIVSGTIMFGREHDQPGILIEPKPQHAIDIDEPQQLAELRNKLWPVIEEANKMAPAFSRIFKEMILITSRTKPLPRTGKGTVMRKMGLKTYDEEIEALYATVESTAKGEAVDPPEAWEPRYVKAWLQDQAEDINSGRVINPSADLFEQGFDSLSATILRRRIAGALLSTKDASAKQASTLITQTTVYNYPIIDELAPYLAALVADPENPLIGKSRKDVIEAMISKYSVGLDVPITQSTTQVVGAVVLITGSTGNLGAQLLETLLQDEKVERVYAVNRASSASSMLERHVERFQDKALNATLLSSEKLFFIEGEAAQDNLGLSVTTYDELRNSVTIIIHTAWRLDFNLSLSSFEPNVRGTRNLIDFARSGPHASNVKFLFTSSVASTFSWDQSKGAYPEEVLMDASYAVGNGYGEGKYVAERILAESGLQATSLRIGQISGGLPNGAWAISDWVPILVKSGLTLGSLPSMTGVASWLPMDAVSNIMLDIAFSAEQAPLALNLVHPRPVEWNALMNSISDAVQRERNLASRLPVIPFQDWFSILERSTKTVPAEEQKQIPAIKLLDFFRGMSDADRAIAQTGRVDAETGGLTKFSTTKAQTVSRTMKTVSPIGTRDAALWVSYWNKAGLFD